MNPLLLAYYGDDFTGSADVMEALARAGYRTVLFLSPPSPQQLAQYPGLRAFGIAGGSRTLSPAEMERALPRAFSALRASGAPIAHYKLCSTFDSSPDAGSIGKAIELGRQVFGEQPTPLAVGLPLLGRYVVFGNLFARSGLDTEPVRLDRHPTMSRHPVTPMNEADLRRVLALQTSLPVELIDVLRLDAATQEPDRSDGPAFLEHRGNAILLFDTLSESHLAVIGRAIASLAHPGPLFVAGSSAVEYALVKHWAQHPPGTSPNENPPPNADEWTDSSTPSHSSSPPLLCISGSCSPVTDRQIERALAAGFAEIALNPVHLLDSAPTPTDLAEALAVLGSGRSLVLHTSRGPADRRFQANLSSDQREKLGQASGELLGRLLKAAGLKRAVVCGGDTSMAVARALQIEAVEFAAPAAPGSPLCRVHAPGRSVDGCEIVFKGGQNGRDRFLLDVLDIPVSNRAPNPSPTQVSS